MKPPTPAQDGPIARRLLTLALPVIGLNVLNVLALAVDTAMLGTLPNAEVALTGLGFASQYIFLLMVLMMGLTVGTVAFVARAFGAGKMDRVNHILRQSSQLTLLLGVGVAVVGTAAAGPFLSAMGATGESWAAGHEYLTPLLIGTSFQYLNILYAAVLRGVRNTRLAFFIALASNLLNVGLNYGLILGNYGLPALGIQGAAIGTVLSQAFAVTVMVVMLRRGVVEGVKLPLAPTRVDTQLARDLVRVGSPAAMDMLVINASFLSIVGMLGRIDEVSVAAHGIGLRIQALAFVPGMSISQATAAMVGNALGANNVDEARRVVKASVVLCCGLMSTLGLAIILGTDPIIALFSVPADTALHGFTTDWILLLGLCMPPVGIYIAFVGMLQGSGATRVSLAINSFATVVFQVPLSLLLAFPLGLGAFGAWAGFPLALLVKAALGAWAYRKGDWAKVGTQA